MSALRFSDRDPMEQCVALFTNLAGKKWQLKRWMECLKMKSTARES